MHSENVKWSIAQAQIIIYYYWRQRMHLQARKPLFFIQSSTMHSKDVFKKGKKKKKIEMKTKAEENINCCLAVVGVDMNGLVAPSHLGNHNANHLNSTNGCLVWWFGECENEWMNEMIAYDVHIMFADSFLFYSKPMESSVWIRLMPDCISQSLLNFATIYILRPPCVGIKLHLSDNDDEP